MSRIEKSGTIKDRMKNRTCRPTATGRKENEDKNPRKNRARQKKLQVERPDGHPTQGQLSLSRKSPTPTSDRVDTWEPRWDPRPMMIPDDDFRPASAKDYNVTWFPGYDQFWTMWESNRWAFDAFFTPCERPSDVDEGFMDWYRAHSHPLITSPSVTRQIPRELIPRQIMQRLSPFLRERDHGRFIERMNEWWDLRSSCDELIDQYDGGAPPTGDH